MELGSPRAIERAADARRPCDHLWNVANGVRDTAGAGALCHLGVAGARPIQFFWRPAVAVHFGLSGCAHLGQMGLDGLLDGQPVPGVHKGQE